MDIGSGVSYHLDMARPLDTSRIEQLISTLNELGGSAGNYAMMNQLGWSESEYWRIRDKAIEAGLIVRGAGRGGSIRVTEDDHDVDHDVVDDEANDETGENTDPKVEHREGLSEDDDGPPTRGAGGRRVARAPGTEREEDLYEPCLRTLRSAWANDRRLLDVHVEVTASQGRRDTGGEWTRPDITAISMRVFRYWPGKVFDIWTFEVKPSWRFSVAGIFEAAAHARAATHSTALFHTAGIEMSEDARQRMVAEAQRLGVGLVFFGDPQSYDSWEWLVDPQRMSPDPSLLEQFAATQLSEEARAKLLRWSK